MHGNFPVIEYGFNKNAVKSNLVLLSSCLALQLWYSLGLLNSSFPFEAILDLFCPFYEFHLLRVVLTSSSHR